MSSASTRYSTMSAGTMASIPSARVTRFLLSEYFACSGVSTPLSICSCSSEWSWVSCSNFRPRMRGLVDALVRRGDLLLEQERRVRESGTDVDFRQLAPGLELRQQSLADDVHRDAARHLAGVVPAHAVGQYGEAGVAVDEDRVLVVRTHHSRMREDGAIERGAFVHRWRFRRVRRAVDGDSECECNGHPRLARVPRRATGTTFAEFGGGFPGRFNPRPPAPAGA